MTKGMFLFLCVSSFLNTAMSLNNDFERLKDAVLAGNILRLKKLIEREKADVASRNGESQSVLHVAAKVGNTAILRILLESTADPDPVDIIGKTPLHTAALNGHKKAVAILLGCGADLSAKDKWGRTPLHEAAEKKKKRVVKYLLLKGADIDAKDNVDNTPFHLASCSSNSATIRILLKNRSNTLLRNKNGRTALAISASCGRHKLFKILSLKPHPQDFKDNFGNSLAHLAVLGKSLKLLKNLIKTGESLDLINVYGRTPLHMASESCLYGLAHALVCNGADVNARDSKGYTPHDLAAKCKKSRSFNFLIKHGTNLDSANNKIIQSPPYIIPNAPTVFMADEPLNKKANSIHQRFENNVILCNEIITEIISDSQKRPEYDIDNRRSATLEALSRRGINLTEKDDCNNSLLHNVVSRRNLFDADDDSNSCSLALVKVLLELEANLNAVNCNGKTPLHLAVEFNNLNVSELLIKKGADIEFTDSLGKTPLFISVERNNLDILHLLLSYNASVHVRQYEWQYSPLHIAARKGRIEAMGILLDRGANIEEMSTWYDRRPLHEAVYENQSDAVKYLISRGADVNAKDNWERTSLHLAAEKGFADIGVLLLDAKADVDPEMREFRTPLVVASENGKYEISKLLLERGADFRHRSQDKRTVLHWASGGGNVELVKEYVKIFPEAINTRDLAGKTPLYWASYGGNVEIFKWLIINGADPLVKTDINMTILHAIAESGNIETAKEGLKYGVNINEIDLNGRTALCMAAMGGHMGVFYFFLNHGADPNIRSKLNETLLHCVAFSENVEFTKAIIDMTNNINAQDREGITPIYRAAINGRYNIFEILLDKGADPTIPNSKGDTIMHWAAYYDDIKVMNRLLNKHIKTEYHDNNGETPLYVSAQRGKFLTFKALSSKGANFHVSTTEGMTLIHGATIGRNIDIIKFVLNASINVNARDNAGRTSLFIAAKMALKFIFDYLLENGADMNLKTYDGKTVLHASAFGGNFIITETILKKSNLLNSRDEEGKSALFYAAERQKLTVFNLLLKSGADTGPASRGWSILHSAAKGGNGRIFDSALKFTKDMNAVDDEGRTPLFVSVFNYKERIFNTLLDRKANPDIPDKEGFTVLHLACKYGDVYLSSRILNVSAASANAWDIGKKTPLHWAVYYGHEVIVKLLLRYNADPEIENIYGYTPLMLASAKGSVAMMELFSSISYNGEAMLGIALAWSNRDVLYYFLATRVRPTEKNKLHFAAARGDNIELVELFRSNANAKRERFYDITKEISKEYSRFTTSMGEDDVYIINPVKFKLSPLEMAILFNGSVETIKLIMNMTKATSHDLSRYKGRWTPLDMAAFCGKDDLVKYFIGIGIPACITGGDSWTSIHKAAWGGHNSIIKFLYENGVDINAADSLGRTPLHIAAMRGYNFTVDQILQLSNSSINAQDRYNFTPLHLTEIYGHQKYFDALALVTITIDASLRYAMKDPGLVTSSLRNHTRTLELLLDRGADPNAQDRVFGWTVLHWSAAVGHVEVARILLDHGAKVNLPSRVGQTPMYVARYWWRTDVYEFLKENNGVW